MVNKPDCGSGTRGFDPHISPHYGMLKRLSKLDGLFSYLSILLILQSNLMIFLVDTNEMGQRTISAEIIQKDLNIHIMRV